MTDLQNRIQDLTTRAVSAASQAVMGIEHKVRLDAKTVFRGKVCACEFSHVRYTGTTAAVIYKVTLRAVNGNEKVVHLSAIHTA